MRNTQKALLFALLENTRDLVRIEQDFNYTDRLVLLEELKTMPFGAVWDYYCLSRLVPVGRSWLQAVKNYETKMLVSRN
jgi:L-rhamnose isomerase